MYCIRHREWVRADSVQRGAGDDSHVTLIHPFVGRLRRVGVRVCVSVSMFAAVGLYCQDAHGLLMHVAR